MKPNLIVEIEMEMQVYYLRTAVLLQTETQPSKALTPPTAAQNPSEMGCYL